ELLARDDLTEPVRAELNELVNQTGRLRSMIEDLLLLSRLDAGRLQIEFAAVDLAHLVASWLDDLSILPEVSDLAIETEVPADLCVAGERRYVSLILQNLLENARKYNRPGGRIRVTTRTVGETVVLVIGNTGTGIAPEAQGHIFERFHRAAAAEDIPGHGLGLNLAQELARLHGGDVRLASSTADWTEFEVSFRLASHPGMNIPSAR
ncbi:MAG: HAMP domain-containing histidine kinase, partial [Opitutaceae bacterium]|nr:HAMP domain-containing histidine kinase [Opitutaceae bacterium]